MARKKEVKRGRPKGSKNKVKVHMAAPVVRRGRRKNLANDPIRVVLAVSRAAASIVEQIANMPKDIQQCVLLSAGTILGHFTEE